MGFAQWMRVVDTLSGLVQLSGRLRRPESDEPSALQAPGGPAGGGALGQLEARLAGVMVAALKEVFDRDTARLELERSQIEADRKRAEEALRAELRRQTGERLLAQLKTIAVMAIGSLGLSAALGIWLPGIREGFAKWLLGGGWLFAIATLGAAFGGWQQVSAWSGDARNFAEAPRFAAAAAAPWLLIAALILTALSLLIAL